MVLFARPEQNGDVAFQCKFVKNAAAARVKITESLERISTNRRSIRRWILCMPNRAFGKIHELDHRGVRKAPACPRRGDGQQLATRCLGSARPCTAATRSEALPFDRKLPLPPYVLLHSPPHARHANGARLGSLRIGLLEQFRTVRVKR